MYVRRGILNSILDFTEIQWREASVGKLVILVRNLTAAFLD